MDRLLAWAFIIIVIENQRKWCKSTKNRQKNFVSTAFCNIHLSNKTQNQILLPMAQPPRSIYCSTLINPQAHSLVSFHASFIFPKIAPAFLRENPQHWGSFSYIMAKSCTHWSILSYFRKFLPHWGIFCRWSFPEKSPLTVSIPCVFLFSFIFLRFDLLWLSG